MNRGVGAIGGVSLAFDAGRAGGGGDSLVLGAGSGAGGGDFLALGAGSDDGGGDLLVLGAGSDDGGGDLLVLGAGSGAGGGDLLVLGAGSGAGGGGGTNEIWVPSIIQLPRDVPTTMGIRCNRLAKTWVSSGHAVTRWVTNKGPSTQPGPQSGGISDFNGTSMMDFESGWTLTTVSPLSDTRTRAAERIAIAYLDASASAR